MNSSKHSLHYEPLSPIELKKKMSSFQFNDLIERMFNEYSLNYQNDTLISGFKVISFHFRWYIKQKYTEDINTLLNTLTTNRKTILILRRNYEEQRKSYVLAMYSTKWLSHRYIEIYIPKARYKELAKRFDELYGLYHQKILEKLATKSSVLTIYYEDFITNTSENLDTVASFLDIEKPSQWKTSTIKKKNEVQIFHSYCSYIYFLLSKLMNTIKLKTLRLLGIQ